nr:thioesterase family protein [Rivibacter subsaxonicus]
MVFFPQYLVLLNGLVEDWFTLELGIDYATLIGQRLVGLPTVSLQCEFAAPSRMGEPVDFSLQVERLGGRSITLAVACHGSDGQLRMRLRQVLVSTGRSDDRTIDIPPDVRAAIAHWQSKRGQQP